MHSDYVMRIIQQFVKFLIEIATSRKAGKYEEALEQIQSASRFYLKTDINLLLMHSPVQLLDSLNNNGQLDAEKCVICADLLYEWALICEAREQTDEAMRLRVLCLHLYASAIPNDSQFQKSQYQAKVALLISALKEVPIEPGTAQILSNYERFSAAEAVRHQQSTR